MLSTENPPPDPPEIPQLKSGSSNFISSDEKASPNDNSNNNNNNNNQSQLEVDLFKSGLDDIHQTLPKFSIRDYVFSTRGNDIKTHWPFSSKNLQLCLKHGVKDLLPPFETLDSVRNPSSIVKCADENTNDPSVKLSGSSHRLLPVSSKNASQKLAENTKSNTSRKGKEYYPATTTSPSCSDVNSVPPPSRSPFLEPEPKNLPDLEKPEFTVRAKKVNSINNIQNPVKKCRLIVRLGNNTVEHKPIEDLSETMASKVCPVCKTFTSSSNTTLNAHIDQCLCGESTIKCTTASKAIKHRIKPRKTRLMVDIYATAIPCTLEDLDRRNGTNWASNFCFPAQDLEDNNINDVNINNNNNNTYSSMNGEDKDEEGGVYFDSNGTKLRILSKLSDVKSISKGEDNGGPRKLVKRDQGSKTVTSKKMKKHMVLKYPPYEQRRSPGLDRCPDVIGAREMKEKEKEELAEPLKACEHQIKSNDSGMIKQWVSSKRTGPIKKKNTEHEIYHPNKSTKNSRIKSHLSSLDDKLIKKTIDSRFPISSNDNPRLATDQSRKRKEIMPSNSDDEYMPCRTNRAGFSLLDSRDYRDEKRNHMMLSKSNVNRLKEKSPSVSNGTGNHTVSRSTKKMKSISSTVNGDSSFISSSPSKYVIFSSGGQEFGSRSTKKTFVGKKLSSLSKKLLESKKYLGTKRLDFKKPAIQLQNRPVEKRGENASHMEKNSGNLFTDGARVLKIRKKRWGSVNSGKERDASPKHSNASSESNSDGVEQNIDDSFVSDCIPAGTSNDVKAVEEFVREPISKIPGGEPLTAFGESLAYEGRCSSELALSGEQETLSAEKVDANQVEGNYFVGVDPIPIPGPPGSFLPSPGRMGSEELQGNSSLTTCKLHSSEDERELIDHMDSSDSGKSLVYNSIATRSDHAFRRIESERVIFENRTGIGADGPKLNEPRAKLVISETKLAICGDCESPGVSTPNSVLRLMGKNLMVVNKDEINPSPQTRPTRSNAVNDFPNPRSSVDSVISTSNIRNEHRPSFHDLSRGPPVLENSQTCMQSHHQFDFASSVRSNFKAPEISPHHLSRVMLSSRTCNEGSGSSLDCREYGGGYVFNHDPIRSTARLDAHTPVPRLRTSESYGDKCKEVIVIGGSPENEARLGFKTTYTESMQAESLGYCDSGHVNPFFGYQTRCYPLCSGTQMVQHADTHVPNFNGMNGNSVIWNRTPEGRNSLTDSLPSNTGHPRSLYFSSGFSLPTNFT